jgi:octopine/nopaline transport system permease protein
VNFALMWESLPKLLGGLVLTLELVVLSLLLGIGVAIGVISGAYSTEVIRGAVLAVPPGQIEAAKAIGMPRRLMFRRILLPQVARFALPGLGNVWQFTLKDTALISVTGLVEIMRQAHIASGSTRQPFTFYLVAAMLYLLLTSFSNYGFKRAEGWANRGERRAS